MRRSIEVYGQGEHYAHAVQDAIFTVMDDFPTVAFESRVAILGVAIGAMLMQLPDEQKNYFTDLFIENVCGAGNLSELMVMN